MYISRKQFHIMQNERHMNRRVYIIKKVWGNKEGWRVNHFYVKNKVHCSCPICAVKTNTKHHRFVNGRKNWKHSDLKRMPML